MLDDGVEASLRDSEDEIDEEVASDADPLQVDEAESEVALALTLDDAEGSEEDSL